MIIITDHAREEMNDEDITEEEVHHCVEYGTLELKLPVKGEMRYGKQYQTADNEIMVIYTLRGEDVRVITAHTLRRKKW